MLPALHYSRCVVQGELLQEVGRVLIVS
jgi:hypothetical protein